MAKANPDPRRRHRALAERDGAICFYCGRALHPDSNDATIDHVIAVARGGSGAIQNMVLCCAPCNHAKGDRTIAEWFAVDGMRVPKARRHLILSAGYGHANRKIEPTPSIPFLRTGKPYPRGYPLHPSVVQTLAEALSATDDELRRKMPWRPARSDWAG